MLSLPELAFYLMEFLYSVICVALCPQHAEATLRFHCDSCGSIKNIVAIVDIGNHVCLVLLYIDVKVISGSCI